MNKLIITFLLFIQSLVTVQPDRQKVEPSASNIVFQSSDGGKTWQDISDGLPKNLRARCVFADHEEVFLGLEEGVYRGKISSPAPKWRKDLLLSDKITDIFPGQLGPYFRSLNFENGFSRELSNTGVWFPVYTSLNVNRVRSVLETQDGSIFVSSDNGIFKSTDNGKTWKQVLTDNQVMSLIEADGVIIGGAFKGVLRSTDSGEHWDLVLTDSGSIRKTGLIDGHFVAITNGKGSWKEIMADSDGLANSLLFSPDSGKTWKSMDESLIAGRFVYDTKKRQPVQFINDIEQLDGYLFCSLDSGIYRSSNHGKTWELMLPSCDKLMFNFAVSGKVIYAIKGTFLGGC